MSMTLKMLEPQVAPQSAALTLYSLNDSNFYIYDLTSSFSNTTANGLWNNLTIPVGPSAQGWTAGGTPTLGQCDSSKIGFQYPSNSNITIRIGALFFHGQYQTPIQYNGTGLCNAVSYNRYSLQFHFSWFLLTGVIYIFFKALKANITWKPCLLR